MCKSFNENLHKEENRENKKDIKQRICKEI